MLSDQDKDQYNRETNQFNLHLARTLEWETETDLEWGGSLQWGQLHNEITEDFGSHNAIALFLNGNQGPWNLKLQSVRYHYLPNNPQGVSNETILMGGFNGTYLVASKGWVYDVNLSYVQPVDGEFLEKIKFFGDYSYLKKDKVTFNDSQIASTGIRFFLGQAVLALEYTIGKNAIWIGKGVNPMAEGEDGADWNGMIIGHLGYRF